MTRDEAHAGGSATTVEAALAFRPDSLFQMAAEVIEGNVGKFFSDDVEQRDPSVTFTDLVILFFSRLRISAWIASDPRAYPLESFCTALMVS
ncbi:unnamed protein product [Schistocephalus solidus]|uniref:TetR_C_7 domain-containing protein n=1 Tax=Schistocephalus solidus TaxID=70667 RepID=A0A183SF54_SCHSO|nr:unnamed protein product [Schistocephalus solidus]